jgi:hypothetical protein
MTHKIESGLHWFQWGWDQDRGSVPWVRGSQLPTPPVRELRSALSWPWHQRNRRWMPLPTLMGSTQAIRGEARSLPIDRSEWPSSAWSAAAGSIWGYVSDCYSETDSVAKREPHMRSPLWTFDRDDSLVIDRKAKRG